MAMHMHSIRTMMCAFLMVLTLGTAASSQTRVSKPEVDLLLVLAADVSNSITEGEFHMQRDGFAAAITDPQVLRAATSGPHRRIAVILIEWSSIFEQRVLVDWTIIDGLEAGKRFASQMAELPRSFAGATAIGAAIDFSVKMLENAPFTAERMVIDVSGDGTNNSGGYVERARDDAVRKGIVINGLAIFNTLPPIWYLGHTQPEGGLDEYYRSHVIGGPGSFVMVAENFRSFGAAIRKKMIAEIAMR
jgi:hypothetical protein